MACSAFSILINSVAFIALAFSILSLSLPNWSSKSFDHGNTLIRSNNNITLLEAITSYEIGLYGICYEDEVKYIGYKKSFKNCANYFRSWKIKENYCSNCSSNEISLCQMFRTKSTTILKVGFMNETNAFWTNTCGTMGKVTLLFAINQMLLALIAVGSSLSSLCCNNKLLLLLLASSISAIGFLVGIITTTLWIIQSHPLQMENVRLGSSFILNIITLTTLLLSSVLLYIKTKKLKQQDLALNSIVEQSSSNYSTKIII